MLDSRVNSISFNDDEISIVDLNYFFALIVACPNASELSFIGNFK